jgi:hypothetical protein
MSRKYSAIVIPALEAKEHIIVLFIKKTSAVKHKKLRLK